MSILNKFYLLIASFVFCGCSSDYKITQQITPAEAGVIAPEIDVSPITNDFGILASGSETRDAVITIDNTGNGDLNIGDVFLHDGGSNFSLTVLPSSTIEPSQYSELVVTYEPGTYETNSDIISILSNDEDEPEILVYLDGSGDAPVIHVTPSSYDFGTVFVGCDDSLGILIENYGNANLEITDVEYFASLPVDFSIEDFESSEGLLPWTIVPGGYIHIQVEYTPLDILDDGGWLEITSNDPASPIAVSDHEGIGNYEAWVVDTFTQDGDAQVDILFVVDNSGSMSSNQTNLKNNFGDFMSVFVSAGVDYHVALVTTDDAAFVGSVITSSTPDPITEFSDQIDLIGYSGAPIEKGLWYSYESTVSGGDAAPGSSTGFFRSSARLVVVYVSDEPDASINTTSYGGGSSTMMPSDYSAHLLALKTSPDLVVAHAVAGDYPSGCTSNGGAQFGDGYYDVVSDLGGTFMSICAADWSVTMDTLARESMAMMSFTLSDYPIEDTIAVEVDGVSSSDWSYDDASNIVIFSTAPDDGSTIDITYAILADCSEETK